MTNRARVVFMGTPDFAVPALKALVDHGYDVVCVVTQPDRPVGRKQVETPSPVKVAAERLGLTVFQPEKVRAKAALEYIAGLEPDVCVTAAYGQILPQALLDIPRVGCLNVHASLLPRWRGAAPIHRAILAGDKVTGVTIMEMVLALDAGPVIGTKEVPITDDDNVGTLHDQLMVVGAQLLIEVLPGYLSGSRLPAPQSEVGVTYAERLSRQDEFIDWGQTVEHLHDHVRGLSPWPGATTSFRGTSVKIWKARKTSAVVTSDVQPGQVIEDNQSISVRCANGWLQLLTLQPSGKKKMTANDWFRGLQAADPCFDKEVKPV